MKSQPKPDRYEQPAEKIDYSRLPHPKSVPARDARFRAFARSHGCQVRGKVGHVCGPRVNGKVAVDFAHIGKLGLSIKSSDYRGIGLCHSAHVNQTDIGWKKFAALYDIDPDAIAQKLVADYEKRGGTR